MMLMMLTALVASAKDIKTVMFTTNPQMQSADCGNKIKSRLQLENGVELIKTDLKEQKVMVKYDAEKTTPCKIVAAFSKLGYTTQPVEISQNACSKEGKPNCTTMFYVGGGVLVAGAGVLLITKKRAKKDAE